VIYLLCKLQALDLPLSDAYDTQAPPCPRLGVEFGFILTPGCAGGLVPPHPAWSFAPPPRDFGFPLPLLTRRGDCGKEEMRGLRGEKKKKMRRREVDEKRNIEIRRPADST
jgi:hypothetical protein